ncbi:hypothetical protein D3C85_1032530 [compost metagenome]
MLLHHGDALVDGFIADQARLEQLQPEQAAHAPGIVQLAVGEGRAHLLDAFHLQVVLLLLHQPAGRHQHQAADAPRLVQRQLDGDGATQGVAHQHAALDIQGVQQAAQGIDEEVQAVGGFRLVGSAVAGQVWHYGAVARTFEHRVVLLEVAVATGARAATVDEDHRLAFSGFQIVQAQTIRQRDESPLR